MTNTWDQNYTITALRGSRWFEQTVSVEVFEYCTQDAEDFDPEYDYRLTSEKTGELVGVSYERYTRIMQLFLRQKDKSVLVITIEKPNFYDWKSLSGMRMETSNGWIDIKRVGWADVFYDSYRRTKTIHYRQSV